MLVISVLCHLVVFGGHVRVGSLKSMELLMAVWVDQLLGKECIESWVLVVKLILLQSWVILFSFPHDCITINLVVLSLLQRLRA